MPKKTDKEATQDKKRRRPVRVLLSKPRRLQSSAPAAKGLGAILAEQVERQMAKLTELDLAIEKAHRLIEELMSGGAFLVGVEWAPHKTRPGLHPVVFRTSHGLRRPLKAFVRADGTREARRAWADVLQSGYLGRNLACHPAVERTALPMLQELFSLLHGLLDDRARLLETAAVVRRLLSKQLLAETDVSSQLDAWEARTVAYRSLICAARRARI
jgi:hypothetical protein